MDSSMRLIAMAAMASSSTTRAFGITPEAS
jgi:hypothetical protein